MAPRLDARPGFDKSFAFPSAKAKEAAGMKKLAITLLAASLLSGCGGREALKPAPGQALPVAPALAARAPTTEEMLTPPPIAKPDRVDELLRRSEPRQDDRFDLPPH
jgi:hypothetical protein